MKAHGFSLVELLVALTVCLLLSGAIAAVAPQARAAFETTPEILDLQQRERTVADVLTRALRSGALLSAAREDRAAGTPAPSVELLDPDESGERFATLRVLALPTAGGRGLLEADQGVPSGVLRLRADAGCPSAGGVCGFSIGTVAAIVNAGGAIDVFTIGSTNNGANSLSPASALSRAYGMGAAVFAVTADTYYLQEQADASLTLVRETAGGAIQPVVDDVADLSFSAWRAGEVIRRLHVTVRLEARTAVRNRHVPNRTRHLSIALRNPS